MHMGWLVGMWTSLQVKGGGGNFGRRVPSASVLGLTSAATGKKGRTTCSHIGTIQRHKHVKRRHTVLSNVTMINHHIYHHIHLEAESNDSKTGLKSDTYCCLQSSWGCQETPLWVWPLLILPSYSENSKKKKKKVLTTKSTLKTSQLQGEFTANCAFINPSVTSLTG